MSAYEKNGKHLLEWENADLDLDELYRKLEAAQEGRDDHVTKLVAQDIARRQAEGFTALQEAAALAGQAVQQFREYIRVDSLDDLLDKVQLTYVDDPTTCEHDKIDADGYCARCGFDTDTELEHTEAETNFERYGHD